MSEAEERVEGLAEAIKQAIHHVSHGVSQSFGIPQECVCAP